MIDNMYLSQQASVVRFSMKRLMGVAAALAAAGMMSLPADVGAQSSRFVTTPAQKATAQQVAQQGVPLEELAPNAPDQYTVKRGDTLWRISSIYLRRPWRWPELWGMNLDDIRNPHLIFPGQVLYLDKRGGRARLSTRAPGGGLETVKVSPRTRYSSLADEAIPTIPANIIEPFLSEALIVNENELQLAPRIVASGNERVLLAKGDRAYARASLPSDLSGAKDTPQEFRVYRNATPLRDPNNGQVLAYEAAYLGKAELVRPEGQRDLTDKDGKPVKEIIPATIDIIANKEEMRTGDRLAPEPKREFTTYVPRAPQSTIEGGRIMSIYGSAVANAGQNMVVTLNRGKEAGLEVGHVMAILKNGATVLDRTSGVRGGESIKLPDERNGLLMVFKTYDKVSYALVLQITEPVRVGDRLINPR
jgi:hypothetical protein